MTLTQDRKMSLLEDQLLVLTGIPWDQFEAIEAALENTPGIRLRYCQGLLEIMSISERHERLKGLLGLLLEQFFLLKGIEFDSVGNATRQDAVKSVQFEPDESYYLGSGSDLKPHPDLALEVVLTSGGLPKLERYQLLGIPEVWFWQQDQLLIYHLGSEGYGLMTRSGLLPDLDPVLLVECMGIPSRLEAVGRFKAGILGN